MGYNTDFEGELKFTCDMKASDLPRLVALFGEDRRRHPEWNVQGDDFYYIHLELCPDFSGIRWDGTEKTGGMHQTIEFIIRWMRQVNSSFGLCGTLLAQGEEIGDCWRLEVNGTIVETIQTPASGATVMCPDCYCEFIPKEE